MILQETEEQTYNQLELFVLRKEYEQREHDLKKKAGSFNSLVILIILIILTKINLASTAPNNAYGSY